MKCPDSIGLYIHIPFCQSKCPYCDFYSLRQDGEIQDRYLAALLEEIRTRKRAADFVYPKMPPVDTVYIGGGTPSFFGGKRIAALLEEIRRSFRLPEGAEITVEANPSSATPDFLNAAAQSGANRLSLGLQSAVDTERRALGRLSGAKRAEAAVHDARRAGFSNISLDLMCAIPGQTVQTVLQSVDFCAGLGVEHVSSYLLKIEKGTVFDKKRHTLALPDEDEQCEMYLAMADRLEKTGYRQYEISNFALPGRESRHNTRYWKCGEYWGVGASAHSFLQGKRFFFSPDIEDFLTGKPPVSDGLGGDGEEFIMLGLRLAEGIRFADFEKRFSRPFPESVLRCARETVPDRYLTVDEVGMRLTREGFLLSNTVLAALLSAYENAE